MIIWCQYIALPLQSRTLTPPWSTDAENKEKHCMHSHRASTIPFWCLRELHICIALKKWSTWYSTNSNIAARRRQQQVGSCNLTHVTKRTIVQSIFRCNKGDCCIRTLVQEKVTHDAPMVSKCKKQGTHIHSTPIKQATWCLRDYNNCRFI